MHFNLHFFIVLVTTKTNDITSIFVTAILSVCDIHLLILHWI